MEKIQCSLNVAQIPGIYVITNSITKAVYFGESLNVKQRLKQHKSSLLHNKHYNYLLQSDFLRYGADSFEFQLLQPHFSYNSIRTKAELIIIESAWCKWFAHNYPDIKLYNLEDTLDKILNNEKSVSCNFHGDKITYTTEAVQKYIVSILLTTTIQWIEDVPCIIKLPTLDDLFEKRPSQKRLNGLLNKIPQSIMDSCISMKTLEYINRNNIPDEKTKYIIKNQSEFTSWLISQGMDYQANLLERNMNEVHFIHNSVYE